jgi:hypothetical protein
MCPAGVRRRPTASAIVGRRRAVAGRGDDAAGEPPRRAQRYLPCAYLRWIGRRRQRRATPPIASFRGQAGSHAGLLLLVHCGSRTGDRTDACSRAEASVVVSRLTPMTGTHHGTSLTAHAVRLGSDVTAQREECAGADSSYGPFKVRQPTRLESPGPRAHPRTCLGVEGTRVVGGWPRRSQFLQDEPIRRKGVVIILDKPPVADGKLVRNAGGLRPGHALHGGGELSALCGDPGAREPAPVVRGHV